MIKTIAAYFTAAVASLSVHAVIFSGVLSGEAAPTSVYIPPAPTASEVAAVESFAKLDQARVQAERIKQAETSLASQLSTLPVPDIEIPASNIVPASRPKVIEQPVPKTATQKVASTKQTSQPATSPPTPAQKTAPAKSTINNNAANNNTANNNAAKTQFGKQVFGAISKSLHAPRNIKNLRATLTINFVNGKFSGAQISQSSGNAKFDQAVLTAAIHARYPAPPNGLARSISYRLPVSI